MSFPDRTPPILARNNSKPNSESPNKSLISPLDMKPKAKLKDKRSFSLLASSCSNSSSNSNSNKQHLLPHSPILASSCCPKTHTLSLSFLHSLSSLNPRSCLMKIKELIASTAQPSFTILRKLCSEFQVPSVPGSPGWCAVMEIYPKTCLGLSCRFVLVYEQGPAGQ